MDFVEATRKEIGAHENDKEWKLVRRRSLNVKNTIMYIWSFKINRYPYGRLIKPKSHQRVERGSELLGDLLPSGKLDACQGHAYYENL